MNCPTCGDKPKKMAQSFTKAVIEIDNPEQIALLRKVVIPASMGDDESIPAAIGKYRNVILHYEANQHTYIYSSDGIPTFLEMSIPEEVMNRIATLETSMSKEILDRENADTVLQNNINAEALTRKNADDALGGRLTTVEGIAATALQPAAIDKVVMTDISLNANSSTTTVQIDGAKENLLTGAQTTKNIPLPVASHDEAGVMNSSTFDAVTNNTSNINALMNGAVAITGLSASPSQSDLTTAWQTETGLTALMNRAGIYDVTNNKVWTYYTNDSTWYAATNTSQVTINTFTNSAEGTIKGSTNVGQIFAENDGTGSVNGWDSLSGNVSTNTNDISSLQTTVAGKQDKLTAGQNITITGNVISATGNSYTAGNAIHIDSTDNNRIDADIYPADFFTAGETLTGAGSNITLNETIPAKLKGVELYGDIFQQTYSGKNLFNKDATPTYWYQTSCTPLSTGVRITCRANVAYSYSVFVYDMSAYRGQTITLSANVSVSASNTPRIAIGVCDADGNNRTQKTSSAATGETSTSYTVASDDQYIYVSFSGNNGGTASVDDYADYENAQLEIGSTPTDYEPYVGSTPSQITPAPNPNYPQNVQVVTGEQTVKMRGKNLLDVPDGTLVNADVTWVCSNNTIVGNGTYDSSSTWTKTMDFTDFATPLPVGTYTLSMAKPVTKRVEFALRASDGTTPVSGNNPRIAIGDTSVTFTTTKITKDFRIVLYDMVQNEVLNNYTIGSLQLEAGSRATDFEKPPKSYIVNLGSTELCKIGDYQDYIYKSGDDWYVHKENAKIVLDGTEAGWAVSHNKEAYLAISDAKGNNTRTYSNLFTNNPSAVTETATWGEYRFGGTNNNLIFFMAVVENTDLAGFKTWLASHNTIVYYQLATPTDTKITDDNLIGQLNTLASANAYLDVTHFLTTATDTNLPVILDIVAYKKSLDGIINSIPNAQVQSNWTQADTTAPDYIKNKPSIPAAQIQSDWDQADNSAVDYIKNKPTIPTVNDATLTIQQNGVDVTTFTANASSNATANITSPVITMTTTDPGEGSPLSDNHFIGVYDA